MKICNVCGFQCEDEVKVCPTCGKNCDGSESHKTENSPKGSDPFEKYRQEIDSQIKQQEKKISELQEKIRTEEKEKKAHKKKEKVFDESDKTELFDEEDAKNNRLFAVLIYFTGAVGIIISLLYDKESPYLKFHIKEGLKLLLSEVLLLFASFILCWTFIVPMVCAVAVITVNIIKLICAYRTAKGFSKEVPVLNKISIFNK